MSFGSVASFETTYKLTPSVILPRVWKNRALSDQGTFIFKRGKRSRRMNQKIMYQKSINFWGRFEISLEYLFLSELAAGRKRKMVQKLGLLFFGHILLLVDTYRHQVSQIAYFANVNDIVSHSNFLLLLNTVSLVAILICGIVVSLVNIFPFHLESHQSAWSMAFIMLLPFAVMCYTWYFLFGALACWFSGPFLVTLIAREDFSMLPYLQELSTNMIVALLWPLPGVIDTVHCLIVNSDTLDTRNTSMAQGNTSNTSVSQVCSLSFLDCMSVIVIHVILTPLLTYRLTNDLGHGAKREQWFMKRLATAQDIQEHEKELRIQDILHESTEKQRELEKYIEEGGDDMMFLANWECNAHDIMLREEIGRGKFGTVFLCTFRGSTHAAKVVVKLTKKAFVMFRSEAVMMAKLQHPHIIRMVALCLQPPKLVLVMEFAARGTLQDLIMDPIVGVSLPRHLLKIALDVSNALLFLHQRNAPVIHRDIKSENVLVTDTFQGKLADFGESTHHRIEKLYTTVGTPFYIAPEVLIEDKYDTSVDIYSLGMIIYEMTFYIFYITEASEDLYNFISEGGGPLQALASFAGQSGKGKRISSEKALKMACENWKPNIPEAARKCYPNLMSLIERCWSKQPQKRPKAKDLILQLRGISKTIGKNDCFELSAKVFMRDVNIVKDVTKMMDGKDWQIKSIQQGRKFSTSAIPETEIQKAMETMGSNTWSSGRKHIRLENGELKETNCIRYSRDCRKCFTDVRQLMYLWQYNVWSYGDTVPQYNVFRDGIRSAVLLEQDLFHWVVAGIVPFPFPLANRLYVLLASLIYLHDKEELIISYQSLTEHELKNICSDANFRRWTNFKKSKKHAVKCHFSTYNVFQKDSTGVIRMTSMRWGTMHTPLVEKILGDMSRNDSSIMDRIASVGTEDRLAEARSNILRANKICEEKLSKRGKEIDNGLYKRRFELWSKMIEFLDVKLVAEENIPEDIRASPVFRPGKNVLTRTTEGSTGRIISNTVEPSSRRRFSAGIKSSKVKKKDSGTFKVQSMM